MFKMPVSHVNLASFLLALLLAAFSGCGPKADLETAELRSNMRALAVCYGDYMKTNRGRAPKSEKALRKWLEKRGDEYLEVLHVDTVDDIFISSRDNEPYVVIYGKPANVIAYESVGIDGKRFVADNLGVAMEVDEAKFAEMVPDAK